MLLATKISDNILFLHRYSKKNKHNNFVTKRKVLNCGQAISTTKYSHVWP